MAAEVSVFGMDTFLGITANTIYAWVLFGSLGMIYVAYGKMKSMWQPRVLGGLLMFYPYFVSGDAWLWGVGIVLVLAIFVCRD